MTEQQKAIETKTFLAFVMRDSSPYYDVEEMIQDYRDLIFWQSDEGRAYCSSERDWKAHIAALQCTLNNTYEKYVRENPDAKSFEEEMQTLLVWQQRKADMLAGDEREEHNHGESGKALCITSGSRLGEEYTALAAEMMCR